MANDAQKTHLALSLNRFAEKKVAEAIQLTGRALPCSLTAVSGSIVTVKFELNDTPFTLPTVTVPVAFPEYMRPPFKAGDKGVVLTSDAYLGGVSGIGGGTATLSPRANLSSLVFVPVSNKGAPDSGNPNAFVLYGPDGCVLRTTDSTCKMEVTGSGAKLTFPGGQFFEIEGNVKLNGNLLLAGSIEALNGGTYAGDIKTAGNVVTGFGTGNQVDVQLHTHKYEQPTGGSTEEETAAPTAGT